VYLWMSQSDTPKVAGWVTSLLKMWLNLQSVACLTFAVSWIVCCTQEAFAYLTVTEWSYSLCDVVFWIGMRAVVDSIYQFCGDLMLILAVKVVYKYTEGLYAAASSLGRLLEARTFEPLSRHGCLSAIVCSSTPDSISFAVIKDSELQYKEQEQQKQHQRVWRLLSRQTVKYRGLRIKNHCTGEAQQQFSSQSETAAATTVLSLCYVYDRRTVTIFSSWLLKLYQNA
jgi:hypothetical protein